MWLDMMSMWNQLFCSDGAEYATTEQVDARMQKLKCELLEELRKMDKLA